MKVVVVALKVLRVCTECRSSRSGEKCSVLEAEEERATGAENEKKM